MAKVRVRAMAKVRVRAMARAKVKVGSQCTHHTDIATHVATHTAPCVHYEHKILPDAPHQVFFLSTKSEMRE